MSEQNSPPSRFTPPPDRQQPRRSVAPVAGRFDGLLLVDKPVGPTSHDVVAAVRRTFRLEKVGHGGTLDPNATGLLVLLLGKGTSLSAQVMGGDKRYAGRMLLGTVTDSQDIDGKVLAVHPCGDVTEEALREGMRSFTGDIYQVPPMVSAIKKDGVPLYKLARKGREVEREPRLVHVYDLRLLAWTPPLADFEIACGRGTYVRTICHDLGAKLGCGACLHSLRRLECGRLSVADALPLAEILRLDREGLARRVIPYYSYLNAR